MSSDFAAARLNMVESQIRTADVTDLPLQDALRVVPREACVPAGKGYLAYADADVEYAPGRWLLRPREVGKLLQHLRPREGDKALAVGGRLGVVERVGPVGRAVIYVRAEDGVGRRAVFDATPPMLAGFAVEQGFAF